MKYRHLGKTGIQVSELSFGSWVTFHTQAGIDSTVTMLAAAYDAGVNFFDNADMYADGEAEVMMGKAIKDLPREALVISSKVFWPTPSPTSTPSPTCRILKVMLPVKTRRIGWTLLPIAACWKMTACLRCLI